MFQQFVVQIADEMDQTFLLGALDSVVGRIEVCQRWSRFAGQFGGLAKVDSGFDYAANFSSFACLA